MFDRLEEIDKDKIRGVIAIAWAWFFGIIATIIVLVAAILAAIPIIMLVLTIIIAVLLIMPATFIYPGNSFTCKDGAHSWSWSWDWRRGFKCKRKTLTEQQVIGEDITKPAKEGPNGDSKIP